MSAATFFRLVGEAERGERLREEIDELAAGRARGATFSVEADSIRSVPGSPVAYWIDHGVRQLFDEGELVEGSGRAVRQGLATADDTRFLRLWWEVPSSALLSVENCVAGEGGSSFVQQCRGQVAGGRSWVPIAKGGKYSPFASDVHLVVSWEGGGAQLRVSDRPRVQNEGYYFRPGLTWPRRSQRGFSLRVLPAGCIFGDKGPSIFAAED